MWLVTEHCERDVGLKMTPKFPVFFEEHIQGNRDVINGHCWQDSISGGSDGSVGRLAWHEGVRFKEKRFRSLLLWKQHMVRFTSYHLWQWTMLPFSNTWFDTSLSSRMFGGPPMHCWVHVSAKGRLLTFEAAWNPGTCDRQVYSSVSHTETHTQLWTWHSNTWWSYMAMLPLTYFLFITFRYYIRVYSFDL